MGKYVVDGLLGPGGVTETYLVHLEAKPGAGPEAPVELFALKLLRPDRVPEGNFAPVAGRFLAAGRQLRDFHRPGFCRVVDVCDAQPSPCIVSEYITGRDLGRLLEACQNEGKAGVHPLLVGLIGSEIARLLHVGHSAKPVFAHLGLSPQNVLVAASGEVSLVDAGIAASLRALTEQAPERWALVAPELQGVDVGAARLDDRRAIAADLYSLGALLFTLLTGRPPGLVRSGAGKATSVELPEIPNVPGKLAAALRTLLSVDPEDRPGDAAVLVEWLAGDGVRVRDRERLIAEGVSASEKGLRVSSLDLTAVTSEPAREPSAAKPSAAASGGAVKASAAPSGGAAKPSATALGEPAPSPPVVQSSARSAAVGGPPRRFRVPLVSSLLLATAAAVLVSLGWWPGHSKRSAERVGEVSLRTQNPRTSRVSLNRGGETPTKPAEPEPPAGQPSALLAQVAGHLAVETVPPGAAVWVDGVLKGKSFVDIAVGEGSHRVVMILPGYRMLRDVVDTSHGAIIRRGLVEAPPAARGDGFIDVSCHTAGHYPVLLDDEETGVLCPARMLPTSSGKHTVGIFVPHERRVLNVETTVERGSKPATVSFSQ